MGGPPGMPPAPPGMPPMGGPPRPPGPPMPTPGLSVGAPMTPPAPAAPAGNNVLSGTAVATPRARTMQAVVVDVVRRTHDCSTIYFFVGDTGTYRAGQFITIDPHQFPELHRWIDFLEVQKGKKEPVRAYSMSSAPGEKCISISTKAEEYDAKVHKYPPLLSPFMASGAVKGREVVISGYSGSYVLPEDHAERTDQVLHFVAGSGTVPNYSIIKDELRKPENARVKHTMINTNKTYQDIIFREQLDTLAREFPERFEVIHMLTREENPSIYGPNYVKGRPTLDFVRKYVRDPSSVLVYSCGAAITKWQRQAAKEQGKEPQPRFMESVEQIVHQLGIDKSRFKKEEFG